MKKTNEVKQISAFLTEKITNLKSKLKDYDNPMMQELTKTSPHLQYDFIRIKTELQSHEDILLAIQKFTTTDESEK